MGMGRSIVRLEECEVSDEAVVVARSGFSGIVAGAICARSLLMILVVVGGGALLGGVTYGVLKVKRAIQEERIERDFSQVGVRQMSGSDRREWLEGQRDGK